MLRKKITSYCIAVAGALIPALIASPAAAGTDSYPAAQNIGQNGVSVIVSVPGLSFLELQGPLLQDKPHLYRLRQEASWGAMNIRTPGKGMQDVYVSWGAGAPAQASPNAHVVDPGHRLAAGTGGELLFRFGGEQPSGLVVPYVGTVKRLTQLSLSTAIPGLLGSILHSHGISTEAWGNADTGIVHSGQEGLLRRYAGLAVMDRAGLISGGATDDRVLRRNPLAPYGVSVNYPFLLAQLKPNSPMVTMVELGDLQRLYEEKEAYSQERFASLKQQVLAGLDGFVGDIMHKLGENDELWIVSPKINSDAQSLKMQLSPVIRYRDNQPGGLLTSETTHRPGIVAYTDLAPSLLARFGLERPEAMTGFAMRSEANPVAYVQLLGEVQKAADIYQWRPPVLYSLAVFEVLALLAALLTAVRPSMKWGAQRGTQIALRQNEAARQAIRTALFVILLIPAALLWMGWFAELPFTLVLAGSLTVVGLMAYGLAKLPGKNLGYALAWSGLLNTVLIVGDTLRGAHAMQHSLLGYDTMIGARYYGVGNELMGVLLGAALLALTSALQCRADAAAAPRAAARPAQLAAGAPQPLRWLPLPRRARR
ncbi:hypothetical protein, partial [Paenibacillus thalictri]